MATTCPATIVVVVEECPAAQELIDQALRERGHRVLSTGDRTEPVRLAQRIRIDLVVGYLEQEIGAVVERVRSVQPEAQVLTLSGTVSLSDLVRAVDETLRFQT